MFNSQLAKTEIHYLSGTGNSLVIAKSLAERIDGESVPIVPLLKQNIVETEADEIGLVFPIYDFKPPPIIQSFVKKFSKHSSKYFFDNSSTIVVYLSFRKPLQINTGSAISLT